MREVEICSVCGDDITNDDLVFHVKQKHPGKSGFYTDWEEVVVRVDKIPHEAEYKDVWIPNIVQVLTGYKCACGATK